MIFIVSLLLFCSVISTPLDVYGRNSIFHGISLSSKDLFLDLVPSLQQKGINAIKIIFPSSLVYSSSQFNESHLNNVMTFIKSAKSLNIILSLKSEVKKQLISTIWMKIVKYFLNEQNIVGYDILDQTSSGPSGIVLKYKYMQQTNRVLLPLYKQIARQIRTIDQRYIFFQANGNDVDGQFYQSPCQNAILSFRMLNTTSLLKEVYLHRQLSYLKQLKVGGIVHGIQVTDIPLIQGYKLGWIFNYSNQIPKEIVSSYAYAVCGQIIAQSSTKGGYKLSLYPKECAKQKTTEIYLTEEFNNGFGIIFTPTCQECKLRELGFGRYALISPKQNIMKSLSISIGTPI